MKTKKIKDLTSEEYSQVLRIKVEQILSDETAAYEWIKDTMIDFIESESDKEINLETGEISY